MIEVRAEEISSNLVVDDYKVYVVNDTKFAVGQFFTMNFDEIKNDKYCYDNYIDNSDVSILKNTAKKHCYNN